MNGEHLKAVRQALKLTQKQFALLLGVHLVTVCNWERGKTIIPKAIALAVKQLQAEAA